MIEFASENFKDRFYGSLYNSELFCLAIDLLWFLHAVLFFFLKNILYQTTIQQDTIIITVQDYSIQDDKLILSKTTKFFLFQIQSVGRRQY